MLVKTKLYSNNQLVEVNLQYDQDTFNSYITTINENHEFIIDNDCIYSKEDLDNEIWKSLKELEIFKSVMNEKELQIFTTNVYLNTYISNMGRAALLIDNMLILQKAWGDGVPFSYKRYKINRIRYYIHRLVAYLFITNENFDVYTDIDHINRKRYCNKYYNLRWCNFNTNNINKTETIKGGRPGNVYNRHSIIALNLLTNEITEYISTFEASKLLSINETEIKQCCNRKRRLVLVIDNIPFIFIYRSDITLINEVKNLQKFKKYIDELKLDINIIYTQINNIIEQNIQLETNKKVIEETDQIDISKAKIIYRNNDESILQTYKTVFTQHELQTEEWRRICDYMPIECKQYLSSNNKDLKLFDRKIYYYVSNLGRIAEYKPKTNTLEIRKVNCNNKDNFATISLCNEKFSVHKIVAYVFCQNTDWAKCITVRHKNSFAYDNRFTNLYWD